MRSYYYFFYLLLLYSCQTPKTENSTPVEPLLYQANDLTADSIFTSGIEGPATDANGNIYLVNFQEKGTIGKILPEGKAELFVRLPEGSTGNGIRINPEGNLWVADYTGHNVLEVNVSTKEITIYAHEGNMNQPNDLAIMKNGTLFCSDPKWGDSTGQLWRVDRDGKVTLLEESMGTSNGVEVSPDEKTLYVNESIQLNVWAYELSENGEISNKRLFHKFEDYGMDGMRCDEKGNLYITRYGKGSIAILNPEGELIREVELKGKNTSNIAFGGPEGKTAYVTLQDRGSVESFETEFPGREWSWRQK
ncbi:MAG: SMP-30/gluconolactonase/LRE family protein [Bacteroidota bacterium]